MMPTQLSAEASSAAEAMDNVLFALRHTVPLRESDKMTEIAAELEEALDSLSWEPRDVRDLRYALRKIGYGAHQIMLPGQESIEYELTAADYAAVQSELVDITNNDGLLLVVEANAVSGSVDPNGLPYIRVSVSREVSA